MCHCNGLQHEKSSGRSSSKRKCPKRCSLYPSLHQMPSRKANRSCKHQHSQGKSASSTTLAAGQALRLQPQVRVLAARPAQRAVRTLAVAAPIANLCLDRHPARPAAPAPTAFLICVPIPSMISNRTRSSILIPIPSSTIVSAAGSHGARPCGNQGGKPLANLLSQSQSWLPCTSAGPHARPATNDAEQSHRTTPS